MRSVHISYGLLFRRTYFPEFSAILFGVIIVVFGPVASGKSTIARIIAERLPGSRLISSDMFRRKTYNRLIREVERLKELHRYVVVDGTFYKGKWREELLKAAGDTPVVWVYVRCSLETCLRRNRERGSPVPERAVHIIWSEFEPPEKPDVEVDTDRLKPEEAAEIVLSFVGAPSRLERAFRGSSQRSSTSVPDP